MSIAIPLNTAETDNAGVLKLAAITLVLEADQSHPLAGAQFVWANDNAAAGDLIPNADGQSALYRSKAAGTSVITISDLVDQNGAAAPWQPGKLYRLNNEILDSNGHIQKVTAASKLRPARYTPEAGSIPQGGDAAFFKVLSFVLTAAGNASAGNTTYTGTITGGGSNAFSGRVFNIAGFDLAPNNGRFKCVGSSTTTLVLVNTAGVADTHAATAKSVASADDPQGRSSVLNQGDGDLNGDWPAGALLQAGANTNDQRTIAHLVINSGPASTAATVVFEAVGFSANGPDGIESPTSVSFNANAGDFIAEYSEIGVGGQKVYLDQAGHSHTGWQIADGSDVQVMPTGIPPVFSLVGGTVVDNDLVWTDQGAASSAASFSGLTLVVTASGATPPAGNFLVVPHA